MRGIDGRGGGGGDDGDRSDGDNDDVGAQIADAVLPGANHHEKSGTYHSFIVNVVLKRVCNLIAFAIFWTTFGYLRGKHILRPSKADKEFRGDPAHFQYKPIIQNSFWKTIRLLELHPGSGLDGLEGRILSTSTITVFNWPWTCGPASYEAVSYCWNSNGITKIMYLDHRLLPITENLHTALLHLRRPDSSRLLWIDQICINQSESALEERSMQVQHMGEIYRNAQRVIAWLGSASLCSHNIFQSAKGLEDETLGKDGLGSWHHNHPELIDASTKHHLLAVMRKYPLAVSPLDTSTSFPDGQSEEDEESSFCWHLYEDFRAFLQAPWFSRIWIVQEAVLATELILQVGDDSAHWEHVVLCLMVLLAYLDERSVNERLADETWADGDTVSQTVPTSLALMTDIDRLRRVKSENDAARVPFLRLVKMSQKRQASDPRDKIYGLRGLAESGSGVTLRAGSTPSSTTLLYTLGGQWLKRDPNVLFPVDYAQSPEQIFMEFTVWCIQAVGEVQSLAHACAYAHGNTPDSRETGGLRKLPSWATDWSEEMPVSCPALIEEPLVPRKQPKKATFHLQKDPRIVISQRRQDDSLHVPEDFVLVLTGLLIDTVLDVVIASPDESLLDAAPSERSILTTRLWWLHWREFALRHGGHHPYGYVEGQIEALWQILVLDMSDRASGAPVIMREKFQAFFEAQEASDHAPQSERASHMQHHKPVSQDSTIAFDDWVSKQHTKHRRRRLFRTRRGLLGISCQHVQPGDKIGILWGGRFPFILREHGRMVLPGREGFLSNTDDSVQPTYKLVGGECYVHGLSGGEGIHVAEQEGILPTKICLA